VRGGLGAVSRAGGQRGARHLLLARRGGKRHHGVAQRAAVGGGQDAAQSLHGAGVQLRHARLVHADVRADALHRDLAEVVEADDAALARRQLRDGRAHALPHVLVLVQPIGRRWLRRHQHGRQHRLVAGLVDRQRRRRLDRVDADDRAAQLCLVGADARGEVAERGLAAQLAPKVLARRLQLAAHAPHAARPRVAAQRVDHRAPHPALGERLELDAARLVEPVRGVDEADHPVLRQVAEVDRVRHRRCHAAGQCLDERQAGDDPFLLGLRDWLTRHRGSPSPVRAGRWTGPIARGATCHEATPVPACAAATHPGVAAEDPLAWRSPKSLFWKDLSDAAAV